MQAKRFWLWRGPLNWWWDLSISLMGEGMGSTEGGEGAKLWSRIPPLIIGEPCTQPLALFNAICRLVLTRLENFQIANFRMHIPMELKVGLTSNQAVNSSLSVVSRSKKRNWQIRTMKGLWWVLEVQGSPQIFHFLWPDPNENNHRLYFCILCNKNGIKGLWGDKGRPHWVPDRPSSFNGPYYRPTIHPTWPFIYWLYLCILAPISSI